MRNLVITSLGVVVGYLIGSSVAHFVLTHRRREPKLYLAEVLVEALGNNVEEVLQGWRTCTGARSSKAPQEAVEDFEWPIPHARAGCLPAVESVFCEGEPLPEEQTVGGVRIKICSECAQLVMQAS